MYYYCYIICDFRIQLEIPFLIKKLVESKSFLLGPSIQCYPHDFTVQFKPVSEIPISEESHRVSYRNYAQNEDKIITWFYAGRGNDLYACVIIKRIGKETNQCFYVKGKEKEFCLSNKICDMLGLETILNQRMGFLLHSSFVSYNDNGILFSAPSGTGKSTQASLWEQYLGAEIINGDRAGIRRIGEKFPVWTAYGLPFAGSSGIYKNKSAPISGVILLEQGSQNEIRRAGMTEAFRRLYPETAIHDWDPCFVETVTDTLIQFVHEVPIYVLRCRPDREAVDLVKKQLLL